MNDDDFILVRRGDLRELLDGWGRDDPRPGWEKPLERLLTAIDATDEPPTKKPKTCSCFSSPVGPGEVDVHCPIHGSRPIYPDNQS